MLTNRLNDRLNPEPNRCWMRKWRLSVEPLPPWMRPRAPGRYTSRCGTHTSTSRPRCARALPIIEFLFQLSTIGRARQRPNWGEIGMKLGTAIAEIMKREGIEILCGYPVNHLIEHAANADIRPVMVRQERIGLHMADAISRVT